VVNDIIVRVFNCNPAVYLPLPLDHFIASLSRRLSGNLQFFNHVLMPSNYDSDPSISDLRTKAMLRHVGVQMSQEMTGLLLGL